MFDDEYYNDNQVDTEIEKEVEVFKQDDDDHMLDSSEINKTETQTEIKNNNETSGMNDEDDFENDWIFCDIC